MLVRDIMSSNIVTISGNTPVLEARKIMDVHHIERLPVVDRGKLVGIVTKDLLLRAAPSPATSLSVWEINYLVAKMTVKEIMKRDVVTIAPDATVEKAVAIAQDNGVGSLPVLEDGRVLGIVTTNDFFYRILNPLLGRGEKGTRLIVYGAGNTKDIQRVMEGINKYGIGIKATFTITSLEAAKNDLIVHLDAENAEQIMTHLEKLGFSVETREF